MKSWMRSQKVLAAILMVVSFTASCATKAPPRPEVDVEPVRQSYQEGSLWPGVSKKNLLFSDNKASAVGDIVTVHVVEKTTALNKARTSADRSTTGGFSLDTGAGTVPTAFALTGGLKNKGRGITGRSDAFSTTVSCVVKEVLPNGNLIVEGQRRMTCRLQQHYH